jgi:hypothetical protein
MTIENQKQKDKVTLKIPRPLYEKIAAVINGAGYNSVTDFVVYVLRDLVASHSMAAHPAPRHDADDLEKVKQRLQALGYLDSQSETDSNSVKG